MLTEKEQSILRKYICEQMVTEQLLGNLRDMDENSLREIINAHRTKMMAALHERRDQFQAEIDELAAEGQ